MEANLILGIIQVAMIIVVGLMTWLRLPYQNSTDNATAVNQLSDSLDSALKRQKILESTVTDLEGRIKGLNDILKEKNYSVTMVFQLGEQPIVKSVIIQPVSVTPTQ